MCGIAGIVSFDDTPVDRGLLERMTEVQAHRGPDDTGTWVEGNVGFGHRRLSIIDLSSAGHQPMESADGRWIITYNGEVYNYVELRRELEGLGHVFRSQTDTEVILKAYEAWGEGCVERFIGMWAFAIWDRRERRLFCSRDPFGIKPFFYLRQDDRLFFASDVRSLLLTGPESKEPDWYFLVRQLSAHRFSRDDDTSFERIRALRPATNLVVADGRFKFERHWTLSVPQVRERYDFDNPVATFRELFIDAVRLHFRSDVPVGVCLSGGLDSSCIVGAASTFLGARLKTFSISYPDSQWSEDEFIDDIVARFPCDPLRSTPRGDADYLDTLDRMVTAHGEPDQGIGVYSQWKVMELARGHVTVLLDGQGGDELLAGYPYFYETFLGQLISAGRWLRALREYWAYRPYAAPDFGRRAVKQAFPGLGGMLHSVLGKRAYRDFADTLHPDLVNELFGKPGGPGLEETLDGGPALPADGPELEDRLSRHLYRTISRDLLQSLLYFEDRNSMAFSLESRVPFLDRRLVEFCLALRPEDRLGDGFTKRILRDSFADTLPERVRFRRDKKGFPTPFSGWLHGPLMDQVRGLLLDGRAAGRRVLHMPEVERRLGEHREGIADHSVEIFNWITLELWFQRFQDSSFEARSVRA